MPKWGPQCCVTNMSLGTHEEVVAIVAGGEEFFAQPAAVQNRLGVQRITDIPGVTRDTSILAQPHPPRITCVLDFGRMVDEIGLEQARRYGGILPPTVQRDFFD